MTATYFAENYGSVVGGTSITVTIPGGITGDSLIAVVHAAPQNTPVTPAGWTAIWAAWTDFVSSSGAAYYKVASDNDPGSVSFTYTGGTSDGTARISRINGGSLITFSATGTATTAIYTPNLLTGTNPGDLTVVYGVGNSTSFPNTPITNYTYTQPGLPWTNYGVLGPTPNAGRIAFAAARPGQETTSPTWSMSSTNSPRWFSFTVDFVGMAAQTPVNVKRYSYESLLGNKLAGT